MAAVVGLAFLGAETVLSQIVQMVTTAQRSRAPISVLPWVPAPMYPLTGWLLSPMFAAVAMSMSSVSVVGNALRLRQRKAVSASSSER